MSFWSRLRLWYEDRMVERVTRGGLLFLLALVLTGLAAFVSANNLIFLLLAVMIATVLVSGFISRLGLADLELDLVLPDHVTARQPTPARLVLKNLKSWFPSFSIRVDGTEGSVNSLQAYFPVVPASGQAEQRVTVYFQRRGIHQSDSFRFSSRFPFGFAERRMRVRMRHELIVYPSLAPAPGFEQLAAEIAAEADARFRGRGHDFHRIRPYVHPESARHVDWRKTARTGTLMVREFAREKDPLVSLYLDLDSSPAPPPWFEHAVECAAYLAWQMTGRGVLVRFTTQDYSVFVPQEADVYAILCYLALVECRFTAPPLACREEEAIAVVVTARPDSLDPCVWHNARLLDPVSLPLPPEPGS